MVFRSTPSTVSQACKVPDVSASGRPETNPNGSITRRRRFNNAVKLDEPCVTRIHSCESGLNETGLGAASRPPAGTQDTIASRHVSAESKNARERPHRSALFLTGLSVEQTGFVPRKVEIDVFLIDLLVAVDPVLLRIVPHGVIPPIEQRLEFGLVDGVAIAAA
jgi:hypothetical protein